MVPGVYSLWSETPLHVAQTTSYDGPGENTPYLNSVFPRSDDRSSIDHARVNPEPSPPGFRRRPRGRRPRDRRETVAPEVCPKAMLAWTTSTMNAVRASESARATRAGGKARGTHRIATRRDARDADGVECVIRVELRAWTTIPRRRMTA